MNSTEYFAIQTNVEENMVGGKENFTKRELRPPQAEEPAVLGKEPPKHRQVFKILNYCFAKSCLKK